MARLNNGSISSDDFILFPVVDDSSIYPTYVQHSQQFQTANNDIYESHSHASDIDYTAMLSGEDSLGELHSTSNGKIVNSFSLTDSSSVVSYQPQGYVLPLTSSTEPFDLSPYPNIPRTIGDFYSSSDEEEQAPVEPPHFIIHPPTFTTNYQFNHAHIGGYHSTPGASPSTTAGFEGFGSSATHSSIHSAFGSLRSANSSVQGSPYSAPEDNWSTGAGAVENVEPETDNWNSNGFINPLELSTAEAIDSAIDDSPAESPFYIPPTPQSHSDSPSPILSKRRTPGRLSTFISNKTQPSFPYPPPRRDSFKSTYSRRSTKSPRLSTPGENPEENMQSPSSPSGQQSAKDTVCPECHKTFRDMKAHLLTHKEERPEKCPIPTCDYARRGFARKYDCQRHTLTHYKGTMVCGFCPCAGSPSEKSFNRADVFKRHLMSVHHVEQSPPHSKKRPTLSSTGKHQLQKAKTPELDGSGKCSTCNVLFNNPQKFYEHLDECVLNKVVEIEPAAAYNELNLDQVDKPGPKAVIKDMLEATTPAGRRLKAIANGERIDDDDDDDDDEDLPDADDVDRTVGKRTGKGAKLSNRTATVASSTKIKRGVRYRISKATTKDGRPRTRRGGKKRKNFPAAWGCPQETMVTKRRCLMVYDGPSILWRDEMMMHDELQVRARLGNDTFVSDLDVWTHQRAQDVFRAAVSPVEVP